MEYKYKRNISYILMFLIFFKFNIVQNVDNHSTKSQTK